MAEKTLSQIPRHIREQFEKGKTAFDRKNFDYAVAIFGQVLEQEPAFYDCRQYLRAAQIQKSGGSGSTTFFKKMLGGAPAPPRSSPRGQVELMRNPVDALKTAEQILKTDPNSMAAHKLLAQAAIACEFPKTAILSLQIVTKNAPKDEDAQKDLAPRLFRQRRRRKSRINLLRIDAPASRRPSIGRRAKGHFRPQNPVRRRLRSPLQQAPVPTATSSRTKTRPSPSNRKAARSRATTSPTA